MCGKNAQKSHTVLMVRALAYSSVTSVRLDRRASANARAVQNPIRLLPQRLEELECEVLW